MKAEAWCYTGAAFREANTVTPDRSRIDFPCSGGVQSSDFWQSLRSGAFKLIRFPQLWVCISSLSARKNTLFFPARRALFEIRVAQGQPTAEAALRDRAETRERGMRRYSPRSPRPKRSANGRLAPKSSRCARERLILEQDRHIHFHFRGSSAQSQLDSPVLYFCCTHPPRKIFSRLEEGRVTWTSPA